MTDGKPDESFSLIDQIKSLCAFCADGNAVALKEIYTTWTYSETVRYGMMIRDHKTETMHQFDGIEDPFALMLMMLRMRLR